MMAIIASETESSPFMKYNIQYRKGHHGLVAQAVAQACVNILHEVNAKAIVTFSITGKTSKLISKQRPSNHVYAFSPLRKIYNRLSLVWCVTPLLIPPINDTKDIIEAGEKIIIRNKFAKKNDLMIIVTGLALRSGSTNLIKIHTVGKED